MKIELERYTSGRSALEDLCSAISRLERKRRDGACVEDLVSLAELLLLRGDLLGCIADHDLAEAAAEEAIESFPGDGAAILTRARICARFHQVGQSEVLLDLAMVAGCSRQQIQGARAALLQATGQFWDALELRDRLARERPNLETLGALATLSAEMGQFALAEMLYAQAIKADDGIVPLRCAQLLYAWARAAMRQGDLARADELLVHLEIVLPWHMPGRAGRAEIALARGDLDGAAALIESPLEASDDPAYVALNAQILAARGEDTEAANEAQRAAAVYDALLERRPEAYVDEAAKFFMGVGNRPLRAVELAAKNLALRDTPCARALLSKARRAAVARTAGRTVQTFRSRAASLKTDRAPTLCRPSTSHG